MTTVVWISWNLKCCKKCKTFWAQHAIRSRKLLTCLTMKKHSKTTNVLKVLSNYFSFIHWSVCVCFCSHTCGTQVTVHPWRAKENLVKASSLSLCRFWGFNSGLQATWQSTSAYWAISLTVCEKRLFIYQYLAKNDMSFLEDKMCTTIPSSSCARDWTQDYLLVWEIFYWLSCISIFRSFKIWCSLHKIFILIKYIYIFHFVFTVYGTVKQNILIWLLQIEHILILISSMLQAL